MNLILESERVPLTLDDSGTLRIAGTRVTFVVLIEAYTYGNSAEELASQFASLSLADIYSVLSYYLRHRELLERDYLLPREQEAQAIEEAWKAQPGNLDLRDSLLERRSKSQSGT